MLSAYFIIKCSKSPNVYKMINATNEKGINLYKQVSRYDIYCISVFIVYILPATVNQIYTNEVICCKCSVVFYVRGIDFVHFYIFSILHLFRQCGISLFFINIIVVNFVYFLDNTKPLKLLNFEICVTYCAVKGEVCFSWYAHIWIFWNYYRILLTL